MASRTMNMTTGDPTRLILRFSLPLLAGTILQQLDNLVDTLERMDDKLILTRRDQRIIYQIMKNHRRRKHMTFKQKNKNRRTRR